MSAFYERDFIFLRTDFPGRFCRGGRGGETTFTVALVAMHRGASKKDQGVIEEASHMTQFATVTHVLFASFALLPSLPCFDSSSVGDLGPEAGHVVVALLGVPLLAALLASEAKPLVLVFPLCVGTVGAERGRLFTICQNSESVRSELRITLASHLQLDAPLTSHTRSHYGQLHC